MLANEPRQTACLADIPGFGRVYDCGHCGGIHISVSAVTITLSPEAFTRFVTMIHSSAANFETWLHRRGCDAEADPFLS